MTDFKKWDRFDADAAEKEVERKASEEERERARIAQEQRALKSCQDRAARLKSEAVVGALKAKRGQRRRPHDAASTAGDSSDPPKKPKGDPASLARASANEAEAILTGLRGGLRLRDEVVAAAEAGELRRAVTKARECAAQLDAAQALLLEATGGAPATAGGGDCDSRAHTQGEDEANAGRTSCCGGHDHSHAHHGHDHGGSTGSGAGCAAGSSGGGGGGGGGGHDTHSSAGVQGGGSRREEEEESARKEMAGALEVLQRVKAACRVAEGTCLLREGRAAESTETLRELLFENPKSVPAWVARGESFLALGAPLLAGLHFDRALELDGGCTAASRHKESLRSLVSSEADAAAGAGAAEAVDDVKPGDRPAEPLPPPPQTLAHETTSSRAETAVGAGGGGGRGKHCATPAPAEDGAVVDSKRPTAEVAGSGRGLAGEGEPGLTAGVAATASPSRGGQGGRAAGEEGGDGGNGGSTAGDENASAFQLAVAGACENFRAGVVLHQEAFLSTSREKFLRVLELLNIAEAAASKGVAAPRDGGGEETADGEGPEGSAAPLRDGGGGSEKLGKDKKGGVAGGGAAGAEAASSCAESFDGGARLIRRMRLGCHLNIAAAFLLRKTEFESAVSHCTRALAIQPGNSQALVRRAQAHQELGRFRLAVEDLEAAEASVSEGMRHCQGLGERGKEGAEALAEELQEVVKRLEHARWTKVHVGNGKDELPRA